DDSPSQLISETLNLDLPLVDLSSLGLSARDLCASALARLEASRPFSSLQAPLLRCSLVSLSTSEHILLLSMHHIISDGWSAGVLVRELASLYSSFSAGSASTLDLLPIQYADFAAWQRRLLSGDLLNEQISFWTAQLAGA